jgi:mannose-6-phosphate isomerase-like protein (cupin superfamily)
MFFPKSLLLYLSIGLCSISGSAQVVFNPDSVGSHRKKDKNVVKLLNHDSLGSTYLIVIWKEVPLHYHKDHFEQVYVLSGKGKMRLGKEELKVKKGTLIIIPKGTPHALKVTSRRPVRVISFQAPFFDGEDRIFIRE